MSAPFAPGELVVCVDASNRTGPNYVITPRRLSPRGIYRVVWCLPSGSIPGVWKVRLPGDPPPEYAGWEHDRFRKLCPNEALAHNQWRAMLDAPAPLKPSLNPSRHSVERA